MEVPVTTSYLVTGGAGFIGSNFVHHLLTTRDDVLVVDVDKLTYAGNLDNLAGVMDDPRHVFVRADICDEEAMRALFESYDFDYVVNFAAETHVDRSIQEPLPFMLTNVHGTFVLLSCARDAWLVGDDIYKPGVRFLQVSTDEVYGSLDPAEPDVLFTERTPLCPHSPYSASKASADLFVQVFRDTYKLPVNITRCSNNYGPRQYPEKLIPLMFVRCVDHEPLPIYGDGQQVRDWLFVEDHCRAIDAVLERGVEGKVYNVGGHSERTNMQVVNEIVAYVHETIDATVGPDLIAHVADRKGHDRRYGTDTHEIEADTGWKPLVAYEEGLVMTLDWYRAQLSR
jgi:dTDP-glucose 4,6-dehydratase